MILKLNRPYSLNMGEDFEFISNFVKGKRSSSILDYRPLVRGLKTRIQYIIVPNKDPFRGVSFNFLKEYRVVTPIQYKFKSYNYYMLDNDPSKLNLLLQEWKNSNPLVYTGNTFHSHLNNITNYTWAYEFNNQKY